MIQTLESIVIGLGLLLVFYLLTAPTWGEREDRDETKRRDDQWLP